MKPHNFLQALVLTASVIVNAGTKPRPAVGSSSSGRKSNGETRKFIVEVEPVIEVSPALKSLAHTRRTMA
jgi:hypothetical protein